ncbi:MAG: PfkB family carbohydrate kinase [Dehalococcoidia bacterium]|nr:PfkB family carbohydrate kinase [Dehalococcoidia bacterium]
MSVLVVGSVALDNVETPFGKVEDSLGGSATYFATAASAYAPVRLVAVVGHDFPRAHVEYLQSRGVDTAGLEIADGKTFRWAGRYDYDLNVTHTLDTQLNVFADFHPKLPDSFKDSEIVFLANIDPDLQFEVLRQVPRPQLTMMDTMNFWIQGKRDSLIRTIRAVDVVTMNESEVRMFAGTSSLLVGARRILELGPKALIVKKGESGAVLFSHASYFVAPAYPLEEVKDPTGAGDTFAGGFLGYLAKCGDMSPANIRRAVVHGSVVASFTVEDFSIGRLRTLREEEIAARYQEFKHFTHFEAL